MRQNEGGEKRGRLTGLWTDSKCSDRLIGKKEPTYLQSNSGGDVLMQGGAPRGRLAETSLRRRWASWRVPAPLLRRALGKRGRGAGLGQHEACYPSPQRRTPRVADRAVGRGRMGLWGHGRRCEQQKRYGPRDGSRRSNGGPKTRIDPQHQRPWMDEGGEGKMGPGV